jgi:hypothetical protein
MNRGLSYSVIQKDTSMSRAALLGPRTPWERARRRLMHERFEVVTGDFGL